MILMKIPLTNILSISPLYAKSLLFFYFSFGGRRLSVSLSVMVAGIACVIVACTPQTTGKSTTGRGMVEGGEFLTR